ncbi:MAG: type III polyketide synthase [Salibacteraceae bacterium]
MPNRFITHIGTATPPTRIVQKDAAQWMSRALELDRSKDRILKTIYRATAIESRFTVLPDYGQEAGFNFFPNTSGLAPFPGTAERMEIYRKEALPLCIAAIRNGIPEAELSGITHLVVVSCTGFYAPGVDIELVEALRLPASTQRTMVSFMGCYAAFNGLKVADAFCQTNPNAKVLMVCVELCTLHFQKTWTEDNLIANALFADGAAAALVQNHPKGETNLELTHFYCDLVAKGKTDMAWNIGNTGFEMQLSSYVPNLLESGLKNMLQGLNFSPKSGFRLAAHPGGRKILEAIERALDLDTSANQAAYSVLNAYGNMSSATILFVLKALLESPEALQSNDPILSMAFGPGLTLESALLRYHDRTP